MQVASEPVDNDWSGWAESEISVAMNQMQTDGVTIANSRCYSTLCKVELSMDEMMTFDRALHAFSSAVPWKTEGFFYVDENDPSFVVTFIAREGMALPSASTVN